MEIIPLLLLTAAIVIALVLYNVGYAVFIRDTWNERKSRVREPDATDRLHDLVTSSTEPGSRSASASKGRRPT